jgi:hypothetical protein
MPTDARKITGYSDISEAVLSETSIIKQVSRTDITGTPGTTTVKVYVNELSTIADYVPGTGVEQSNDSSNYVTINNLKERAVNELLDGYSVETAPADYVVKRLEAAMEANGEDVDTNGLTKMIADGTVAVGAVTAGAFIIGARYEINVPGSTDFTLVGAADSVAGTQFIATGVGTGTGTVFGVKPSVATIYADLLFLKGQLDNAKAPKNGRYSIMTPEMENLLLHTDSKIVLNTDRGDRIQTDGFVGRTLGFDIFATTLVPAGTNIIAGQTRAFVYGDNWKKGAAVVSLDGSAKFYGDSAIKGRWAYVTGAVRPTLLQLNKGTATAV